MPAIIYTATSGIHGGLSLSTTLEIVTAIIVTFFVLGCVAQYQENRRK